MRGPEPGPDAGLAAPAQRRLRWRLLRGAVWLLALLSFLSVAPSTSVLAPGWTRRSGCVSGLKPGSSGT